MDPTDPAHPDRSPTVVLLGLMGTGKTTVGRLVAEHLGRALVDVDDLVLAQTGMTVRQLWERAGEAGYRPLERDLVVHELSERRPVVLAAPAGVVDDDLVRAELADVAPWTVWLRARPETLVDRVGTSGHRPLLDDDPLAVLTAQAAERAEAYGALASAVVDVDDLDAAGVADRVVAALTAAGGDLAQGDG